MKAGAARAWRWTRKPATKAAAAVSLAGVIAVIVIQLDEGSPDTTTVVLVCLAIGLVFGLLAPRQAAVVAARATRVKVGLIEIGLTAVATAEQVRPPGDEGDGIVVQRDGQGYPEVVEKLKEKLRFVHSITSVREEIEDERSYYDIAYQLRTWHLLDDSEAQFVLDLLAKRDLGLSAVSASAREEFLDASWTFAARFGNVTWDRFVRRELWNSGWTIADFRQSRGHRRDFLAFWQGHWVVMAARVGEVSYPYCYKSTRKRLAKLSEAKLNVAIEGRCVVIPGTPGDRQATVVEEKDRDVDPNVKVLKLQHSLLQDPGRALESNSCNQDAQRRAGNC